MSILQSDHSKKISWVSQITVDLILNSRVLTRELTKTGELLLELAFVTSFKILYICIPDLYISEDILKKTVEAVNLARDVNMEIFGMWTLEKCIIN